MKLIDKLNSHLCLHLAKITTECDDVDQIKVFLDEEKIDSATDKSVSRYQILFNYLHFSVTSETYHKCLPGEIYSGRNFRMYQKSRYIDAVELMVGIKFGQSHAWHGELFHYQLVCSESILDVTSVGHPQISLKAGKMNPRANQ